MTAATLKLADLLDALVRWATEPKAGRRRLRRATRKTASTFDWDWRY